MESSLLANLKMITCIQKSTDVTIIEIEIAILTENRIELKSNFSCIPSNDFSIEALDRL